MFGIGGFNPINMVSQIALGAMTGGMSMIAQMALQIVGQIAQQLIQNVGQQLGLPQGAIDLAQNAFAETSGLGSLFGGAAAGAGVGGAVANASRELGFSPVEQGQVERQAFDATQMLQESVTNRMRDGENGEGGGVSGARGGRGGPQSFLMALALAMGGAIDGKMDDLLLEAKTLDQANQAGDKSQTATSSATIQALGQEVGMLSNALNNAIKSVGEAATTLARKS